MPSMRGILISIRIRSKRPLRAASRASTPSSAHSEVQPNISQSPSATMRLVALSSTTSTWAPRPPLASSRGAATCREMGTMSSKVTVTPSPTLLSARITPSMASMILRARAGPRPVQPARTFSWDRAAGSKMRARCSGARPGPLSRTRPSSRTPLGVIWALSPASTAPRRVVFTAAAIRWSNAWRSRPLSAITSRSGSPS